MKLTCPWCDSVLRAGDVRALSSIGSPCPACKAPIKQSTGQVVATMVMLLPLVALVLWGSKSLYDAGTPFGAMFVIFAGVLAGSYAQRFLPVFVSPARAPQMRLRQ